MRGVRGPISEEDVMPKRKKVKVKTKAEDIGDLTLKSAAYERFMDQAESDIPPNRRPWHPKHPDDVQHGIRGRVIVPDEQPYTPKVERGEDDDEWIPLRPQKAFYPGRTKF